METCNALGSQAPLKSVPGHCVNFDHILLSVSTDLPRDQSFCNPIRRVPHALGHSLRKRSPRWKALWIPCDETIHTDRREGIPSQNPNPALPGGDRILPVSAFQQMGGNGDESQANWRLWPPIEQSCSTLWRPDALSPKDPSGGWAGREGGEVNSSKLETSVSDLTILRQFTTTDAFSP